MIRTPSCEEIDAVFKQSEQVVSRRLIKNRTNIKNAYWGRVKDDGQFPLHSGTRIKGVRLNRIHVSNENGWYSTQEGTLATTRMCEQKVPEVIRHGFEEFFWSPAERTIRTDWICLNELAVREMPADEIDHLEMGMQDAARYVWDEFYRSRYIHFCDNKLLGMLPDAAVGEGGTCEDTEKQCSLNITEDAFIFETRLNDDGTEGEIDERYIRVNVAFDKIANISALSLDMMDEASESLMYEAEAFFGMSAGIELLDVVLPDMRTRNFLCEIENKDMAEAMSRSGYEVSKLKRTLGTMGILRNYSFRHDIHSMRFYPDVSFNQDMDAGAYSPTNPQTWPRFRRVFAYKPVASDVAGIKYVFNSAFKDAPFGITTIFTPRVMESQAYPSINGVGRARKAGNLLGYGGEVKWKNPDWPCNEDREMGYYKMRFGAAIKPWKTEEGYCFFHRIDYKKRILPICCDLPTLSCDPDVQAYSYDGMGGSEGDALTENRPVAYVPNFA